jgi:hypothetical protein
VPEQHLDHADIDLLLEQVGGERVAKAVHRDGLVDRAAGCGVHGRFSCRVEWVYRVQARKQPAAGRISLGTGRSPPDAQPFEQQRWEQGVAVFAAFTLLDTQYHALTVDVADLQGNDFAGAQSCAIGYRQSRAVLEVPGRLDQAAHLLDAQNHR